MTDSLLSNFRPHANFSDWRRRAILGMAATALLSVSLEVSAQSSLAKMLPKEIQDRGTLRVGVNDGGTPPLLFMATDNKTVQGLEAELLQAATDLLGLKIEYTRSKFDGLIPAIKADRVDVAISSIGDLKSRQTQVDFVDYIKAGVSLMVPKGNPNAFNGIPSLCGHPIAVNRGSYQENELIKQSAKCVEQGKKPVILQTFADSNASLLAVRSQRVDAWLGDSSPVGYVIKQSNGDYELAGATATVAYLGFVTEKGKPQVRDAIKFALDELLKNGTYERLFRKWGQEANMLDRITINEALL